MRYPRHSREIIVVGESARAMLNKSDRNQSIDHCHGISFALLRSPSIIRMMQQKHVSKEEFLLMLSGFTCRRPADRDGGTQFPGCPAVQFSCAGSRATDADSSATMTFCSMGLLAKIVTNDGPRLFPITCLVLWFGLIFAGLWPFNFFPRNRVDWIGAGRGVHFEQYGQMYSMTPLRLNHASGLQTGDPGFTLELLVAPQAHYDTISTILCVCDPYQKRDLTVEQWGTVLMMHGYFRDSTSADTLASIWMGSVGGIERPALVTVTSGRKGTLIYVDGRPRNLYKSLLPESYTGSLLLGHSPSGGAAWTGDISGLAFYDRPLAPDEVAGHHEAWVSRKTEQLKSASGLYTFEECAGHIVHNRAFSAAPDLFIPTRFERFRRKFLDFPAPFKRSDVEDTVANILGFIPFGLLLTIYFRNVKGLSGRSAFLVSIILGAITSLFIEVTQVLLPMRDSSGLDLINNIIGTVAGSALVLAKRDRWSRFFERG
jgi:VanZ family protein